MTHPAVNEALTFLLNQVKEVNPRHVKQLIDGLHQDDDMQIPEPEPVKVPTKILSLIPTK